MNQPFQFRDQSRIDADHLNLLATFHFVGAGLALLGTLGILGHYAIMNAVFNNPQIWKNQPQGPPPQEIFQMLKWGYLVFFLFFITSAVLNVLSGIFLRTRKHRSFSLLVAGLNCLHMPLGTVLGVFTFVVLLRSSVRELYEVQTPDPFDLQGRQSV
jgi:hypothetical protein